MGRTTSEIKELTTLVNDCAMLHLLVHDTRYTFKPQHIRRNKEIKKGSLHQTQRDFEDVVAGCEVDESLPRTVDALSGVLTDAPDRFCTLFEAAHVVYSIGYRLDFDYC